MKLLELLKAETMCQLSLHPNNGSFSMKPEAVLWLSPDPVFSNSKGSRVWVRNKHFKVMQTLKQLLACDIGQITWALPAPAALSDPGVGAEGGQLEELIMPFFFFFFFPLGLKRVSIYWVLITELGPYRLPNITPIATKNKPPSAKPNRLFFET